MSMSQRATAKTATAQIERIEMVDALRGYALFGLLMVHMVERFELHWLNPQPDPWFEWVFAIFAGKSFAIFALLFGFSFATIMANQRQRGVDFTARFAWRLLLLLAIGTVHALVYRGDILQVLAMMGLLLIPLDRITCNRVLLALSALLFLQLPLILQSRMAANGAAWAQAMPYFFSDTGLSVMAEGTLREVTAVNAQAGMLGKWSFYLSTGRIVQIAGLFAMGMVLQRSGAFLRVDMKRRLWTAILFAAAILWLALDRLGGELVPASPDQGGAPMAAQAMAFAVGSWLALAATGFQIALFVLLWQTPARLLMQLFAGPGRMTLTLYVLQSIVVVPLLYGYGFGLWDDASSRTMVLVGVAFFGLQILVAGIWYRYFRYGPLEWTWRAATLTTWSVPLRRPAT